MINETWIKITVLQTDLQDCNWHFLLETLAEFFESPLTKLDDRDPLRRNSSSINEDVQFICNYDSTETSRYIFGRYGKKINNVFIWIRRRNNFYEIMIDISTAPNNLENKSFILKVESLFISLCNELNPITGFADKSREFAKKKNNDGAAVDSEEEFLGIFWLNYFCNSYVKNIGKERFISLRESIYCKNINHAKINTFMCGSFPGAKDSIESRKSAQEIIGNEYFVDIRSDSDYTKSFLPKYSELLVK